jgi:3-oxoacyl-[acyl-carrier protein] reductase
MAELTGKVALITGASRHIGIGAAICRALAHQGADVFFTHWQAYDREMSWGADADGPTALQAEIQALGVRCAHLSADLSQPDTPRQLLDAAQKALGPVDILVNNATYSVNADYQALTADILDAHYAVNMRGTFLLTAEFIRRFQAKSGGRIINLTSGQSVGPMPGELPYIATKGAVEAFTTSLAADVAKLGITVNAVDPGATDTGWMSDDLKRHIQAESPRGRIGQPADAARLVAFLASADAEWITGQIIHSRGWV